MLTHPTGDRLRELGLTARGLDRAVFQRLTGGEWIARHQNLLITGKTGTGTISRGRVPREG